ncbi:MAG: diguanylate cyclase, partial [Pseudomonadota bacterium]
MIQHKSVDVVVVSDQPDDAEAVSQTLRNAGVAARCARLARHEDVAESLNGSSPQLIFLFAPDGDDPHLPAVVGARDRHSGDVPIIVVADSVSDETIGAALQKGAQDMVSLGNPTRLQSVALRELRFLRQTQALSQMQSSAEKLEKEVEALVNESTDALMIVQEGIIVSVNPAWMSLLGYSDDADLVGTPALDVFEPGSHAAVKGAMVAAMGDSWDNDALIVKAIGSDEAPLPVRAEFERAVFDDEPCMRILLSLDEQRTEAAPREIVDSTERHPLTGFFRRQRFLNEMEKHLESPSRGGLWVLAYLKPDSIAELREQIGPLSSDDLLLEFARLLQDNARQNDIYGQFGGDLFMVLMPRGTARDAYAWAENLRQTVSKKVFEVAEKSLSATCTIGLARYDSDTEDLPSLILKAQKAYLSGVKAGGNRTVLPDLDDDDGDRAGDSLYVKKIK